MNKDLKKIKAFTLNEMLVVLLITSIVIGMGFAVLRLVQQQMYGISGIYGRNTELNLLRQSLWIDFNQYDGIWYDELNDELLFANELKEVKYQWHKDFVIKVQDTFFFKTSEKTHFFNGEPKESGEIDALDFSTTQEDGGHRIVVYKKNSATSYINQ